jgi:hypothetical protein
MADFSKLLKLLCLHIELFRGEDGDETILRPTKPFFAWRAELRKRAMVINPATKTGGERQSRARRQV